MKKMKKMMALVIAMVMVLAMGMTVRAADTGTITITPPTGVDTAATNSYKVYKVFDATVDATDNTKVSYKLCSGDTLSDAMTAAGFSVDSAGNVSYSKEELDAAAIAAIAAYVTEADLVETVSATGTTAATSGALGFGYYYIATSTGTVVTIDSNNNNPTVNDKNTVPEVDKKITGASSVDEDGKKALAQVGTTVNYSAEITIGQGAKDYIFHDTMETGLSYNNDAAVTGVAAGETTYTVGKDGDDTFTITFNNDYIKTLAVGSKITVTYSATVTSDAITTDPLNNTCYVSYGDKSSNNKTPESEADVYEAKISVYKVDGTSAPLEGAGFVLKNKDGKYYKIANKVVTWVDSEGEATERTSGPDGKIDPFTGLADGEYTLVEKTVPTGYNKAADTSFTIEKGDYTAANLEQEAKVINNAGQELPSTGGIGTTIFYVLGAILVLGAGVLLVTRRRVDVK